jgi:hypothetical protein
MEEIIFKVGVETGDAKSKVDGVTEAVKKTGKETEKAGGSFTNMRKELKNLTLQLQNLDPASKEFEKVAQRAGQIKEQMRGVADAINDADPEKFGGKFQRTAEGIAGAFSAVTGAQAIFGGNSEEIEKQMLKVQGAIALTQGISAMKELKNDSLDFAMAIKKNLVGAFVSLTSAELINAQATGTMTMLQKAYTLAVGTSTGVMKAFRLALISTGIGALVVLLGYLIEKMVSYMGSAEDGTKAQDRFTASMERFTRSQERTRKSLEDGIKYQVDYAKAVGASDEKIYELELKGIDKRNALREKEIENNNNLLYKIRKDKMDAYDNENWDLVKSMNEQIKTTRKKNQDLYDEEYSLKREKSLLTANFNKKQIDDNKKNSEEQAKKDKEAKDKEKEIEKKHLEDKQALKRKYEDLMAASITEQATREQVELALKHQREITDLKAQYETKKLLKNEFDRTMLAMEVAHEVEKENLKKQQEKDQEEKDKAKQEKENLNAKSKIEAEIIALENDFTAKQQKRIELENLDFAQQLQNKELTQGEIEKITAQHEANLVTISKESKDRQIEIDNAIAEAKFNLANNIGSAIGLIGNLFAQGTAQAKTFALIQLGIETAVGFMQGLRIAQQSAIATGPGAAFAMPIFYASQVGAVLNAVGKAKQILGSGTSTQAPVLSTGGNPGSGGGTGSTGVNQQDTEVRAQSTYKVVVVDSDITKMQEKTKKVELISSI